MIYEPDQECRAQECKSLAAEMFFFEAMSLSARAYLRLRIAATFDRIDTGG